MNSTLKISTGSALSLGLSFLLVGVGYALPFYLFPGPSYAEQLGRAPEVLNLFCLVSWMGLSHFVFAYQGHLKSAGRNQKFLLAYVLVLLTSLLILTAFRSFVGLQLFNALAWIYFMTHLLKAEMYFDGRSTFKTFVAPLSAFTFFSFALLAPVEWLSGLNLFCAALVSILPFFFFPFVRDAIKGESGKAFLLISMFLIGEGLIWGKYRPEMSEGFRDGVYTIHVAIASFYHYFKSYAHFMQRQPNKFLKILSVNLFVITLGVVTLRFFSQTPLAYLMGPPFFTLWVWLHQWMSDAFGFLKMRFS